MIRAESWLFRTRSSGANAAHDFRVLEGAARRHVGERRAQFIDEDARLCMERQVVVEGQGCCCRPQEQRLMGRRLLDKLAHLPQVRFGAIDLAAPQK